jgi:phosphoesterase RecJ-like protein
MWRDIKRLFKTHESFILTTHVNPDGDGIGTACALTELLILEGKKVRFVCDSGIPARFAFLNYQGAHEEYDPNTSYEGAEVLVVLDTHKRERIGRVADLIERYQLVTACIDHHKPAEKVFTDYYAIDPKACAVGAMVSTLYKESGYDLNVRAATGIYTSIVCDTGRFSYASTTRKAHKIADECIKLGVEPEEMYDLLYQQTSFKQMEYFANGLKRMKAFFDGRLVIQHVPQEEYVVEETEHEAVDLEHIHEFYKTIKGVECIVLLCEDLNTIRVSMRSKGDIDAYQLIRSLGGGGHKRAAGVNLEGSLDEVEEIILKILKPFFTPKEHAGTRV